MPTERVLIVAKTKMMQDVCVGAITNSGLSRRLMTATGSYQPRNTPFQIGDVWEISYEVPANKDLLPPHVENIHVVEKKHEKSNIPLLATLTKLIQDKGLITWSGHVSTIFGGLLEIESSGSAFIEQSRGIPSQSTGFWLLDEPLVHVPQERDGKRKSYYHYQNDETVFKVPYVGFESSVEGLESGTLLRVSLARWWEKSPGAPKRCYLQLSGWYL